MGYLIDSGVLIACERKSLDWHQVTTSLPDEPVAISSLTAAELLHGVHRADTSERRRRRHDYVEALLAVIPTVPYTMHVARIHARVWADLQQGGQMIGPHDLILAATCLSLDYKMVTTNDREFTRVPGLSVETWSL